jgi:hypothetical protein
VQIAIALGCARALLVLIAFPASALESTYKATSASSADVAWAKVGVFCGVANYCPELKCELSADGKTRMLTTARGVSINQLESRDDTARTYSYTMISGPLPVANYHSTISVVPAGAGSVIVWSGKYDAKGVSDFAAKALIDGIYKACVDNLAK